MELNANLINQIYGLITNVSLSWFDISKAVLCGENIPEVYVNDEILVEYYNGLKEGKTFDEMREICLPKYILRELNIVE